MEDRMRIKLLSLFCGAALGLSFREGANKQVISSQADSLI
ncbi:hypothetical protein, partial [Klebsiella pneumoniae]